MQEASCVERVVPATPGGSSTGQLLMTRQGERRSAPFLFGGQFGRGLTSAGVLSSGSRNSEDTQAGCGHQGAMFRGGGTLRMLQGVHFRTASCALAALSTPGLEPGKALQAAQTLANLSLQSAPRSQLAAAPALDAMLRALRMYQNAAGTQLLIAFARLASEAKLVKDLASHAAFCSTLLEFAESPTSSAIAGRVLALCTLELPLKNGDGYVDDGRVLAVLTRLMAADQTEIQTDVLRAFARVSRFQYGAKAMSQHGVWRAILDTAQSTHVGVIHALCANILQQACETSRTSVEVQPAGMLVLEQLASNRRPPSHEVEAVSASNSSSQDGSSYANASESDYKSSTADAGSRVRACTHGISLEAWRYCHGALLSPQQAPSTRSACVQSAATRDMDETPDPDKIEALDKPVVPRPAADLASQASIFQSPPPGKLKWSCIAMFDLPVEPRPTADLASQASLVESPPPGKLTGGWAFAAMFDLPVVPSGPCSICR